MWATMTVTRSVRLAGWSAVAAALLTVASFLMLMAYVVTGSPLTALSDLTGSIAATLVTVPVALALFPVASRTSRSLATIALAADLIGVVLTAGFAALMVLEVMTFEATLLPITVGHAMIGVWLAMTAALVLAAAAVPSALG
jgi:hypothetical protein